jgi:hypothetical protein
VPKALASLPNFFKDFKESTRMAAKDAVAVVGAMVAAKVAVVGAMVATKVAVVGAMGAEEFHHIIANRWF